jgi:hypothetical protein
LEYGGRKIVSVPRGQLVQREDHSLSVGDGCQQADRPPQTFVERPERIPQGRTSQADDCPDFLHPAAGPVDGGVTTGIADIPQAGRRQLELARDDPLDFVGDWLVLFEAE